MLRRLTLLALLWPALVFAQSPTPTTTPTQTPTATPDEDFGTSWEGCVAPVTAAPTPATPGLSTPTPQTLDQWTTIKDATGITSVAGVGSSIQIVATPGPLSGHGSCQLQMDRTASQQTFVDGPLAAASSSAHVCGVLTMDTTRPPNDWTELARTKGTGFSGCQLSYNRNIFTGAYKLRVIFGAQGTLRCGSSANDFTPCACPAGDPAPCISAPECLDIGSAGEAVCDTAPIIQTEEFSATTPMEFCLSEKHGVGGAGGVTCQLDLNGQTYSATHPYGTCDTLSGSRSGWACTADADCAGGTCTTTGAPIKNITDVVVGQLDIFAWPTRMWLDTWVYGPGLANLERKMAVYRVAPAATGSFWATGMSTSGCSGSGASNLWTCIKDLVSGGTTIDSDTTRIESALAGQQRSFDMENVTLGAGEKILGAAMTVFGRRFATTTGDRISHGGIAYSGSVCEGTDLNWVNYSAGDYRLFDYTWCPKRPNDNAFWDETSINAAEMGLKRNGGGGDIYLSSIEGEVIVAKPITPPATNMRDINGDGEKTVAIWGDSTHAGADMVSTLGQRLPGAQNVVNMAQGGKTTRDFENHLTGLMAGTGDSLFPCTSSQLYKGVCGRIPDYAFFQSGANDIHGQPPDRTTGVCYGGERDGLTCQCNERTERIAEQSYGTLSYFQSDAEGTGGYYCPTGTDAGKPCGRPVRTCVCCSDGTGASCEDTDAGTAGTQFRTCTSDSGCPTAGFKTCPRACADDTCGSLNFCNWETSYSSLVKKCVYGCKDSPSCRGGVCAHAVPFSRQQDRVRRLVARVAASGKTHMILVLPPRAPGSAKEGLGCWDPANGVYQQTRVLYKELAAQYGFSWVDLDGEFTNECKPLLDCYFDGIHYSAKGQAIATKLFADCLNGVTRDTISCGGV